MIRIWPGVVAVVLQSLLWFGVPIVAPDYAIVGILGAVVFGLVVIVWWLFFSRAPWAERIGAIALMVIAVMINRNLVDPSIAGGAMGNLIYLLSIVPLCIALVVALLISRNSAVWMRRVAIVAGIVLACGTVTLVRTGGMNGEGRADIHWRWTPTPEEKLLAQAATEPVVAAPATELPKPVDSTPAKAADAGSATAAPAPVVSAPSAPAEWPGFRGPERDDVVRGVRIETDWSQKPPIEIWRKPIGPAWSSFAVQGKVIYTQEQRGEDEVVSSYSLDTGAPVWRHKDRVRFYESNGGAGPRATPALGTGRLFSLGATGILNALDARTGAVLWSRNAVTDTGATIPGWGISGSPLLVGELVIVAASGRLAAYDVANGQPRWKGPVDRGGGYSSPHLVKIDGVDQILLMSGKGVTSVAPADGKVLWTNDWEGAAILQPVQTPDGDLLVTMGDMMGGIGTRRLAVARGPNGWTAEERWTSRGLKPYFNDIVVHEGFAYGFDANILACIDLKDGARKWKGGRYGNGQLVLLADQDLLLVLSEEGDIALVKATPDGFTELAKSPAIEGKTWNHFAVAGDVLLVRNGEEMVAFRLPVAVKRPGA
jgi:outer membrane protein assembly factor BamB